MAQISRRALLQSSAFAPAFAQQGTAPPNILFLISDDHSAPDVGCYGNKAVRTPNLDRLAREGVRFTNTFCTSPQCSPNRSSIFTSLFPHTTSTSRLHTPMPDWEPSFLEPLKDRGYFVGAFRKVHQGPSFDKRWNFYGGVRDRFDTFFDALPSGKPFFLQFGSTDPHRPYAPGAVDPPHDPAKVQLPPFLPDSPEIRQDLAHYYDEISRFDSECGQLLQILEKRNLASNTFVVFTTDNGMPFPRAKGTLYEAGIRLPMIARWPGRFQAGRTAPELISHLDLAPTWLEAAGIEKPAKMQGRSFLPLLLGRSYTPRTEVFAERNWHDNFDPMRCIRTARHKLIFNATPNQPYRPIADLRDSPTWASIQAMAWNGKLSPKHMRMLDPTRPLLELYDLEQDPEELNNLVGSPDHASVLAELQLKLSDWMHDTLDYLPPLYQTRGKADRRRLL